MTALHDPVDELAAAEQRVADLRAQLDRATLAVLTEPPMEKTVDELRDDAEQAEHEDFDRFWSAQDRTGKVLSNVLGIDLHLPRTLPLLFEVEARRLQTSRDPDDVRRMFGLLFGADSYDELVKRGLDAEQFSVLLIWGAANAAGRDMSLPQAQHEYVKRMEAVAQGKALTQDRGATSSGSGRSSKPTSRASTGSKKKRSRR